MYAHFWGFKILSFNVLRGLQKNEFFVDIFFWRGGGGGGSSLNWTSFRGHFYVF